MFGEQRIKELVSTQGYAFLNTWMPELCTGAIAERLGTIVDVEKLLPDAKIPSVQTLRPRAGGVRYQNQYSGIFGLGEFPLHSDLAHWATPPRYIILRCLAGSSLVSTFVMPSISLFKVVDASTVRRAIVRPRKQTQSRYPCALPVYFERNGTYGLRWDSLFLIPVNEHGKTIATTLLSNTRLRARISSFTLVNPGDTLILDNWKVLHGRSSVPSSALSRNIERAYLSEMVN